MASKIKTGAKTITKSRSSSKSKRTLEDINDNNSLLSRSKNRSSIKKKFVQFSDLNTESPEIPIKDKSIELNHNIQGKNKETAIAKKQTQNQDTAIITEEQNQTKKKRKSKVLTTKAAEEPIFDLFVSYIRPETRNLKELLKLIKTKGSLLEINDIIDALKEALLMEDEELITVLLKDNILNDRILYKIFEDNNLDLFYFLSKNRDLSKDVLTFISTLDDDSLDYLIQIQGIFVYYSLRFFIKYNNLDRLTYLIDVGANPDVNIDIEEFSELPDGIDDNLLTYAVYNNSNKNIIKFISENLISIHYKDEYVLGLAVFLNNIPMVKTLIKLGADLKSNGQKMIMVAIDNNSEEMIDYLLSIIKYSERQDYNKALIQFILDKGHEELLVKFINNNK